MSLQVRNFSVVFRDHAHSIQALEDVNLDIQGGQCLALVGESGSGKTTLGKACLGLLPGNAHNKGHILLDGQDIDFSDEAALNRVRWKRLSMVFQDGAESMNPLHRIIDQVAEPLIQHDGWDTAKARRLAADRLVNVGLPTPCHGRFPHQLSGGQIQRCLLAMALILDPDVVILDEPTSALDALSKGFVAEAIRDAKGRGKALLLITHDLEFAVRNADRVAVLYLGQIMETLPAGEMISNPLHPYTMALCRSYPAMDTARDLGGIRGDAFYRLVHQHGHGDETEYHHTHIQVPESSHPDGHAPPTGCLFQQRCTQALDRCRGGVVDLEEIGGHTVRCLRRGIVDVLELRGVEKKYDATYAVRPLDLALKAGELLSLVGETGSGKTTLAMIAAGAIRQDRGQRSFEGRDMDAWMKKDAKSLARRVGIIYQNPAASVSHRFSVFEAVAEPLKIQGLLKDRGEILQRVASVLTDVHLSTDDAFLRRYPHELNMGALQRVCLARALVLSPSLLIADEPTSALDPSVQAKVLKLLLNLQIERGLTMLFVSHDIALARKISDRVGVLFQGKLVELGRASLILKNPAHPYTRLLMESAGGTFQGDFKNQADAPAQNGCPYASRCPKRQDLCDRTNPAMGTVDQRDVACHFPF
ncbi:MAG: ABC transporter ATP-binding protein [Deltaproteobacteria bacterium]|nr:ABC transporter ATP-binding protein [Deltaproteobacteria bacterium]